MLKVSQSSNPMKSSSSISAHLSCSINQSSTSQKFLYYMHMTFLCSQMQSIQTILQKQENDIQNGSCSNWERRFVKRTSIYSLAFTIIMKTKREFLITAKKSLKLMSSSQMRWGNKWDMKRILISKTQMSILKSLYQKSFAEVINLADNFSFHKCSIGT